GDVAGADRRPAQVRRRRGDRVEDDVPRLGIVTGDQRVQVLPCLDAVRVGAGRLPDLWKVVADRRIVALRGRRRGLREDLAVLVEVDDLTGRTGETVAHRDLAVVVHVGPWHDR